MNILRTKHNFSKKYCFVAEATFNSISTYDITDIKTFWKTVKALFTYKLQTKSKTALIEKKVVSGEEQEQIVSEKVISKNQAVRSFK